MVPPQKYKLLKDVPGFKAGTIFHLPKSGEWVRPNGDVWTGFAIDERHVENNPEWFQLIPDEPERPYPWAPKEGDTYCYLDGQGVVVYGVPWNGSRDDKNRAAQGNVFQFGEHVCLAAEVAPLVNAAVKTLPNKEGWSPDVGERVWNLVGRYIGEEFHYAAVPFELTSSHLPTAVLHTFPTEQDAQAVADLFNFFLTTRHDA